MKTILLFYISTLCLVTACSPVVVTFPAQTPPAPAISSDKFTSYDNSELAMRRWLPSSTIDGVIIALHGFNDYSNFIKDSAPVLNDQGLAVYAYDQRGFGQSKTRGRWSGWQTLAKDLVTFIELIKKKYPSLPVYVLGDSMGGAVAIVSMAGNHPRVDGIILAAPAVWSRSEMVFYQRWLLWVAAHTIPWEKVTGKSLDITPSDNTAMLRELGRDPLIIKETRIDVLFGLSNLMDEAYGSAESMNVNTLLLYGEKDEIIPRKSVIQFYNLLPAAGQGRQQMILYQDGYHMLLRDLQSERVIKDIVQWIRGQAISTFQPEPDKQ